MESKLDAPKCICTHAAPGLAKRPRLEGACPQPLAAAGGTAESAWRQRLMCQFVISIQTTLMGAGCWLQESASGCWMLLMNSSWSRACQSLENSPLPFWSCVTCYPGFPPHVMESVKRYVYVYFLRCPQAPNDIWACKAKNTWDGEPPHAYLMEHAPLNLFDDACPGGEKHCVQM